MEQCKSSEGTQSNVALELNESSDSNYHAPATQATPDLPGPMSSPSCTVIDGPSPTTSIAGSSASPKTPAAAAPFVEGYCLEFARKQCGNVTVCRFCEGLRELKMIKREVHTTKANERLGQARFLWRRHVKDRKDHQPLYQEYMKLSDEEKLRTLKDIKIFIRKHAGEKEKKQLGANDLSLQVLGESFTIQITRPWLMCTFENTQRKGAIVKSVDPRSELFGVVGGGDLVVKIDNQNVVGWSDKKVTKHLYDMYENNKFPKSIEFAKNFSSLISKKAQENLETKLLTILIPGPWLKVTHKETAKGFWVDSVHETSPVVGALLPGDLIIRVEGTDVSQNSPQEVEALFMSYYKQNSFPREIDVQRLVPVERPPPQIQLAGADLKTVPIPYYRCWLLITYDEKVEKGFIVDFVDKRSPVYDQIKVGDHILYIDDEKVEDLPPVQVLELFYQLYKDNKHPRQLIVRTSAGRKDPPGELTEPAAKKLRLDVQAPQLDLPLEDPTALTPQEAVVDPADPAASPADQPEVPDFLDTNAAAQAAEAEGIAALAASIAKPTEQDERLMAYAEAAAKGEHTLPKVEEVTKAAIDFVPQALVLEDAAHSLLDLKSNADADSQKFEPLVPLAPPFEHTTHEGQFITGQPLQHDVLFGQGSRSNLHPGNLSWLEYKRSLRPRYIHAKTNKQKKEIAYHLIQLVHTKGGRFLQPQKDNAGAVRFKDIPYTDKKILKKAMQTLREETPRKPDGNSRYSRAKAQRLAITMKRGNDDPAQQSPLVAVETAEPTELPVTVVTHEEDPEPPPTMTEV